MPTILLPALSPTMEEGKLSKWLKKVGDQIKSGDVLAEIETDKATMEIEAIDEGVLTEILVAEGTEGVKVNAPIAVIGEASAQPSPSANAPVSPASRDSERSGILSSLSTCWRDSCAQHDRRGPSSPRPRNPPRHRNDHHDGA